ncbi:class I SAM-dependent methyltransferase [Candidatus Dojkabacteria bacterium]|nr:class I SAM-dependent methyltransferase [Candidatus Dojkabacteria bacterium]
MSKKWSDFYRKHGRFYLKEHEYFERIANRFKTYDVHSIFDMGCGTGRHTISFAEKGFSVLGVDFSPAAIQLTRDWLQSKNLHAELLIADIHEHIAGIADSSFDAVVAVHTLEYSSDKQFDDILREINRILKDGGLFWLVVPSKDTEKNKMSDHLILEEKDIKNKLSRTFRVLEFAKDSDGSFSILAQEK